MAHAADAASPLVTVVVSSYNGASRIARCLEALAEQTIAADVQCVVVDDGSSDDTADVARRFDVEVHVHPENRGISQARNTGIAAASAAIVAFTDDDCVPDPTWLARLLAGYESPDVVAVGGAIVPYRDDTLVQRYLGANNPLRPLELELGEHPSLVSRLLLYVKRMWSIADLPTPRAVYSFAGANMSFRREVLDAVGGFDDRMTFGADDEYICERARERFPDAKLWFAPDALVRHDYVGTLRDLLRRNYGYGYGHARAYLLDADARWPIVFPVPFAPLLLAMLVRRRRLAAASALLVPLVLPQGLLGALRARRPTNLVFSYLRFAEEAAHNAGMVAGLVALGSRSGRQR